MTQRTKTFLGIAGFAALLVGAVLAYNALSKRVEPGREPPRTQAQVDQQQTQAQADQQQTQAQQSAQPQDAAPDFTVLDEEGNAVRLSDMRGKPVVLNFWATWCPYCLNEMPEFDRAHAELGDEIQFMMVDWVSGGETVERAKQYVASQGYGFPIYFDTENEAVAAYAVSGIPATFFIDREGRVVSSQVGALNEASLRAGIERILP